MSRLTRNPGFGIEVPLPPALQEKLAKLPEDGMGYQIVTVTATSGVFADCVVVGGQVVIMPEGFIGKILDVRKD